MPKYHSYILQRLGVLLYWGCVGLSLHTCVLRVTIYAAIFLFDGNLVMTSTKSKCLFEWNITISASQLYAKQPQNNRTSPLSSAAVSLKRRLSRSPCQHWLMYQTFCQSQAHTITGLPYRCVKLWRLRRFDWSGPRHGIILLVQPDSKWNR